MNEKHGPNGFLLGLLIGGAVGALVSSKKGRQILKDLTEYGVEYVGNTINMDDIENILNGEEEEIYEDDMDTKRAAKNDSDVEQMPQEVKQANAPEAEHASHPVKRRLFRGIGKK